MGVEILGPVLVEIFFFLFFKFLWNDDDSKGKDKLKFRIFLIALFLVQFSLMLYVVFLEYSIR